MTRPATLAAMPADDLVATLHPYAQWSPQHSTGAARQIAALVRYLNHATIDDADQAIPDPNTAADILGALHTTSTRLPQLLDQLAARMRTLADDPDLATSSSTDTAQVIAERTAAHLAAARPLLDQLAGLLSAAHQGADRLYLDIDDEDE